MPASCLPLPAPQKPGPSLVVVDSLSAVVAPVLGGGGGQHSMGHALLAGVGAALKALALRCEAAVIVTNHMVRRAVGLGAGLGVLLPV